MSLVERVKTLLQKPKAEWPVIEEEKSGVVGLFVNYAAVLAAIPPAAAFVGFAITGYVGYRVPTVHALIWALVVYVFTLVSILDGKQTF